MAEKIAKSFPEEQLGFAFLRDTDPSSSVSISGDTPPARTARSPGKPRGLAEALIAARSALLDAPLSDISLQFLPLLEFCEAALTRALDVVPTRPGVPFSAEEYRSLRGIGQAQWLLTEEHGKRAAKPVARRGKKPKKVKSEK